MLTSGLEHVSFLNRTLVRRIRLLRDCQLDSRIPVLFFAGRYECEGNLSKECVFMMCFSIKGESINFYLELSHLAE